MSRAFEPLTVGRWQLPQRFVMAPLTRNRAGAGHAPTTLNAEYYGQRASAGLIVTEGIAPSQVGQGYLNVHLDRAAMARFGVPVAEVQEALETAVGGKPVATLVEGNYSVDVAVYYPDDMRASAEAIGAIVVPTPSGARIPLRQLARIGQEPGPVQGFDLDPDHEGADTGRGPGDLYGALAALGQGGDVGAVGTMHRDASAHRDIADDLITGDRGAASGEVDQHVAEAPERCQTPWRQQPLLERGHRPGPERPRRRRRLKTGEQ